MPTQPLKQSLTAMAAMALILVPTQNQAAPLDLATSPLFLQVQVPANIMFLNDDSGSMDWDTMAPEEDGIMHLPLGNTSNHYAYTIPVSGDQFSPYGTYRVVPDQDAVNATTGLHPDSNGVWRGRFFGYNKMYYNPEVVYKPWQGVDGAGVAFADSSITAARINPFVTTGGTNLVDLTANQSITYQVPNTGNTAMVAVTQANYYPAQYYTWTDSNSNSVVDATDANTKVEIKSGNAPFVRTTGNRTDCADPLSCTYAEEARNFANWFSYHRRRILAAKNAVGNVIAPSSARMGLVTLHNNGTVNTQISLMNPSLTSGNKKTLLDSVYRNTANGGTPLRERLDDVGRYYECTTGNPFGLAAGSSSCPILPSASGGACQQNFTVLMTDGFYNDSFTGLGNVDADGDSPNTAGNTVFDGGAYADGHSNTLADISMHYYERDLSTLTNSVPILAGVDNASHQHMVTYTVAFGVNGTLTADPTDPAVAFLWPSPITAAPVSGTAQTGSTTSTIILAAGASSTNSRYNGMLLTITGGTGVGQVRRITAYDGTTKVATISPNWLTTPDNTSTYSTSTQDQHRIDDLRHAAYNGRGDFLNAGDPKALSDSLTSALSSISNRTGSASAVAVNSRSLNTDTAIYQARFTSGEWSGDLRAVQITSTGAVGTQIWSAGDRLKLMNWDTERKILTLNGTTGTGFRWSNLSTTQQDSLHDNPATGAVDNDGKGSNRLNWLRGDTDHEGSGDNFRVRTGGFKLGDLVNSSPVYVGPSPYLPDLETTPHSTFRATTASRTPIVYIGGNDGMVHGFDASSGADKGKEKIAYVPNLVYPNLSKLTNPSYTHSYFVDASPTAGDVFGTYSGCSTSPCWRTLLVGGLGGGGKGIYALDVTDPGLFASAETSANAAKIARWEYTDTDLGYTYGQPTIAKVKVANNDYRWVVIFGNGYNSTNEKAVLYIVEASTGALVNGSSNSKIVLDNTAGAGNGLSTPAVVDIDGDFIADTVYVGDLKGNMWKVDLTAGLSGWKSAIGNTTTPRPLYKAVDHAGVAQPITQRPEVSRHPTGLAGYMVYFGTGKYVENGDKTPISSPRQTFYGVWDNNYTGNSTPVVRDDLLPQTLDQTTLSGFNVRTVTNTAITWRVSGSTACQADGSGQCLGWRVDLRNTATAIVNGEMSVSNSVLIGGSLPRIIFSTLIPSSDACSYGGSGWLLELNPTNGGRLPEAYLDINGDGLFNSSDLIGGTTPPAGIDLGIGITSEPAIIHDTQNNKILKPVSGSSGAVVAPQNSSGKNPGGRQSWRQLQ